MENNDIIKFIEERDRREAKKKVLPRTFFMDSLDSPFWALDSTLQIIVKRIGLQEVGSIPNIYDALSSTEIREEVLKIRPDLESQKKGRLHAGGLRSGDAICLVRLSSKDRANLYFVLMTFVQKPTVEKKQNEGHAPLSPLCQVGTSFNKLRYSRAALDRVFFTADTHFSEERILRYRPQFSSTAEMDEFLIGRWNEVVPRDGIVFHLGDFSDTDIDNINRIAIRLNGKIFLVPGNHDNEIQSKHSYYQKQSIITCLEHQKILQYQTTRIILNHYPLLCYPRANSGRVWQLFGHVHTGAAVPGEDTPRLQYLLPYQYDVGVENNNYAPISLREIVRRFSF